MKKCKTCKNFKANGLDEKICSVSQITDSTICGKYERKNSVSKLDSIQLEDYK